MLVGVSSSAFPLRGVLLGVSSPVFPLRVPPAPRGLSLQAVPREHTNIRTSTLQELIVAETMEKLGLSAAADTLVGDLRTPGETGARSMSPIAPCSCHSCLLSFRLGSVRSRSARCSHPGRQTPRL